jgi:hypothetical protein
MMNGKQILSIVLGDYDYNEYGYFRFSPLKFYLFGMVEIDPLLLLIRRDWDYPLYCLYLFSFDYGDCVWGFNINLEYSCEGYVLLAFSEYGVRISWAQRSIKFGKVFD